MALIQWNNAMSVGVTEIDTQHKRLITMINELSDAMRDHKAKDVIGNIVDSMLSYTASHFTLEEKYFDQFRYPDTVIHKKEHADFVKKVTAFREDYVKGRLGLSVEILYFLSDWLKNHIQGSDRKYAPFFQEKGLK